MLEGSSCSDLPGGTESCCDAAIANADVSCSKAGEGPCMVVELSGKQRQAWIDSWQSVGLLYDVI